MFDGSFYFLKVNYEHFGERNYMPLLEIAVLACVVVFGYYYLLGAVKLYLPRAPYVEETHHWGPFKTFAIVASTVVWPASWAIVSLCRLKST